MARTSSVLNVVMFKGHITWHGQSVFVLDADSTFLNTTAG